MDKHKWAFQAAVFMCAAQSPQVGVGWKNGPAQMAGSPSALVATNILSLFQSPFLLGPHNELLHLSRR